MSLGQTIKKIRDKKNILQQQLASEINIDISDLENIENDKILPEKDILDKISLYLNVSKEYILFSSIDILDVSEEKRELFKEVSPILEKLFKQEYELD